MTNKPSDKRSQLDKFKEAARELETDDRDEAFDAALKKVASAETKPSDATRPSASKKRGED